MSARILLAAALLVGCTDEEEFRAELDAESCSWQAECNAFIDEEECLQAADASWEPVPESCRFRRKKANQCLDGFAGLPCPGSGTVELPVACDEVWDCE